MTLIHTTDPKAYRLRKLASEVRVTEFVPGMRVRVLDPEHQFAGRTGTLEFARDGRALVHIDNTFVPISPNKIVVVPQLKTV